MFPTRATYTRSKKNYIPFLRPIISQLYGQQTRLHYAVPRSTPPAVPVTADADTTAISRFNTQTNTANIKNPFVIPGLKKIIIDPQLNPGLTFATFIEGECNRLARSAGMSVAVNPGNNPFNPYIYMGTRDWARRTSYRPSATRYASAIPSCRCCMSR